MNGVDYVDSKWKIMSSWYRLATNWLSFLFSLKCPCFTSAFPKQWSHGSAPFHLKLTDQLLWTIHSTRGNDVQPKVKCIKESHIIQFLKILCIKRPNAPFNFYVESLCQGCFVAYHTLWQLIGKSQNGGHKI